MAVGTPLMGVNGEITLWDEGGTPEEITVLEMVSWSKDHSSDAIETAPFRNSGHNRVVGQANRKWSVSCEGVMEVAGTGADGGQGDLRDAQKAGTMLHSDNSNRLRLYISTTQYYTPDEEASAEACCYITGYSEAVAAADSVKITFTIMGSGPMSDLRTVT